jgi:crotonobetainyl-CoA:carnitine CoA-transferase CaiB-like acyl-CoA transferase
VTAGPGPLAGVRVLEATTGQAGRTAGMLLADLGADVVRMVPPGWAPAPPSSPEGPEDLCWDRGKRFVATGTGVVADLAGRADLVIDDSPAGMPVTAAADLAAAHPGLVHLAMPPHASAGPWRDLPADPLLTGALGGFAVFHPSTEPGTPIASVVPLVAAVHGALGAVTGTAGVLAARTTGHGRALEVTGLHASAACLAAMAVDGLDVDRIVSTGGRLNAGASFRVYRCGDGRSLHLSALTVDFFLPALTVLDRLDVMVLPGVDGEFTNLHLPDIGAMVGAELERTFTTRPRQEWLDLLADAGVPAAPVSDRTEWLGGEVLASAAPPVALRHPAVGPVVQPGIPVTFPGGPGVRRLPGPDGLVASADVWPGPPARPEPSGPRPDSPLEGLRVVDLSTFVAGPFASTLLAELGASVVKVEPSRGDPYRVFSAPYAAVNHRKLVAEVDLRRPEARAGLLDLLAEADVVVDNLRPAKARALGLGDEVIAAAAPALVRCSVSAFGRSGPFADLPGFDPVMQSRSGLAVAQGGDDEPVVITAPTIDIGTSCLAALGALAGLVARRRTGAGVHASVSLAATASFLQAAELTTYAGRPRPLTGGRDFRGPTPFRRHHRAADGWLTVAARTAAQEAAAASVLGCGDDPGRTAEVVATAPVEHWLSELGRAGVPACPVTPHAGYLTHPYLVENDMTHVVRDPRFGRFRLVRGYSAPVVALPDDAVAAHWPAAAARLAAVGTLAERWLRVPDPAAS